MAKSTLTNPSIPNRERTMPEMAAITARSTIHARNRLIGPESRREKRSPSGVLIVRLLVFPWFIVPFVVIFVPFAAEINMQC